MLPQSSKFNKILIANTHNSSIINRFHGGLFTILVQPIRGIIQVSSADADWQAGDLRLSEDDAERLLLGRRINGCFLIPICLVN